MKKIAEVLSIAATLFLLSGRPMPPTARLR
jgi:hypothetical protein